MNRYTNIAALICACCLMCSCASVMGSAKIPGGCIAGYVLDEDGNPVPGANVSLWQDGHLWQVGIWQYPTGNPQNSMIAYTDDRGVALLKAGGFIFGYTFPGDYVLMAEKDGHKSNATGVYVNESTMGEAAIIPQVIVANVTLIGYHVPTLTPEQRSYTGAITGNIWAAGGYGATGVNMSLWRDGRLVDMPDNPQASFNRSYSGANVDYLFEHLAPGHYTVMAEYQAPILFNDTVPVDVGTVPMRADIILSNMLIRPTNFPVISFTPTVGVFSASASTSSKPTPALSCIISLLMIGIVSYFMRRNDKR